MYLRIDLKEVPMQTQEVATPTATEGSEVVVRAPGEGPATWAMASLFEHLATGDETGGLFCMSLVTQPPGLAPPLHVHTREAEAFYLLEGTMTYRAGDETYRLGAGHFIYLPRGVPHAFRITGTSPARFLSLDVPGGLMDLYDAVGLPAAERRLPGTDGRSLEEEIPRWNDMSPRFGVRVVGPPLPSDT
jgi:quercetin dioxygenase-like cupin family protein